MSQPAIEKAADIATITQENQVVKRLHHSGQAPHIWLRAQPYSQTPERPGIKFPNVSIEAMAQHYFPRLETRQDGNRQIGCVILPALEENHVAGVVLDELPIGLDFSPAFRLLP